MLRRAVLTTVVAASTIALWPSTGRAALRHPTWARKSPAVVDAVAATSEGGAVVTGTVPWPHEQTAMYVGLYSSHGALLWHRRWHPQRGTGKFDRRTLARDTSVTTGPGGSVITAGSVQAQCEADGWFVRVYGPSGAVRWVRTMPGWRRCSNATSVAGVAVTGSTIVVAANHHGCCGDPYSDGYLLEFALDGRLLRTIDVEPSTPKAYDAVTGVSADASGTIYVTGWADGAVPYVMAYTLGGSLLWHVAVGTTAGAVTVSGLAIDVQAGVLAAVFETHPADARHTIFRLIRFSTRGTPLWRRDVRARLRDASAADVAVGPGGRISLAVEHRGRPLLRTFSPGGSALWGARIGTELTHPPALRGVDAGWRSVFLAGDPVERYGKPIGGRLWRYRA